MRQLAGRTLLLTGASSGLGPVLARRLVREGVHLVLSARRRPELESLATELGNARVIPADLAQFGEPERLAAEAGPIDIFVSNAGLPANGNLLEFDVDQIDHALDVNLRSAVVLTRLLLPYMTARRAGHVVLMDSLAGRIPTPGSSLYNATKFGLRGFGHALRSELRDAGVGVSLISPTFVSAVGMWAETGQSSPVRTTTPARVADACVRAIREDKAEVTVAPVEQRLISRLIVAFPELIEPFRKSAAVPSAAIERQRSKR
jgi:short-subunit dehydrogenase